MRRWLGALGLVLSCGASTAQAQLIVHDAIAMPQHSITALQTTLGTLEAIYHSTFWVLDHEPFGDSGLGDGFAEKLSQLESLIAQSEHILWDLRQMEHLIATLFSLDSAPDNTKALQERLFEIRRVKHDIYTQARLILTLQRTAIHTIQEIITLWGRIGEFIGAKSARMNLSAQLSVIIETENKHAVQVAAFQQAMLTDRHEENMIAESMERINKAMAESMLRKR